jgi:hypothetical protein
VKSVSKYLFLILLFSQTAFAQRYVDADKIRSTDHSKVFTFPPVTGTLSCLLCTETLTNKTIAAGSNTITGLTNTNLSGTAGITYANLNLTGALLNADISASAAIANSKLANMAATTIKSNVTGIAAAPSDNTLTSIFDTVSTTQGALLYRNAAIWTALSPGTVGQVLTSGGAAANLSWSTPSPGFVNPMTTAGDIIIGGAAGAATRLGIGGSGQVLSVVAGAPSWAAAGTASPLTTKGDLYVYSTTNARLPVGTNNQLPTADSSSTSGISYQTPVLANFVTNPGIESNTTTGYSLGTVTLTNGLPSGVPTFGTGANVALSLGTTLTNQIAGTASLTYVSTAATVAGDFVASNVFTIDSKYQGKVLGFSINYKLFAGSGNFSGTSTNSFGVAIYDVTNAKFSDSQTGNFNLTSTFGAPAATGIFQVAANATQFRIILYNVTATTGAVTLYLDDFYVGPQNTTTGIIAKAPTVTTLISGSGTYTVPAGVNFLKIRIVGGGGGGGGASGGSTGGNGTNTTFGTSLLVAAAGTGGSIGGLGGAGGNGTIAAPAYGTVLTGGQGGGAFGGSTGTTATFYGGAGGTSPFGGNAQSSSAGITAAIANTGSGGEGASGSGNVNSGAGGGAGAYVEAIIPTSFINANPNISYSVGLGGTSTTGGAGGSGYIEITENYLGANVQMSSDTDTRVVSLQVGLSTSTAVAASGPILFNSVIKDTHSAYSFATGSYVAPISGFYRVSFTGLVNAGSSAPFVNVAGISKVYFGSVTSTTLGSGAQTVFANAGDSIQIMSNSAVTFTGGAAPYVTAMSIDRLSGPSVIAASESVSARYFTSAGQSILNATTPQVNYDTKDYDSHNAVTIGASWKFVAPISGKFQIKAKVLYGLAGFTAGNINTLQIFKNGIAVGRGDGPIQGTGTVYISVSVLETIPCLAGDVIDVRSSHGETAARSLNTTAISNTIEIERVAN